MLERSSIIKGTMCSTTSRDMFTPSPYTRPRKALAETKSYNGEVLRVLGTDSEKFKFLSSVSASIDDYRDLGIPPLNLIVITDKILDFSKLCRNFDITLIPFSGTYIQNIRKEKEYMPCTELIEARKKYLGDALHWILEQKKDELLVKPIKILETGELFLPDNRESK